MQGKKDTKARDVSAFVLSNEANWQYGSGKTTSATLLCSLLLPAYGNPTREPLRFDQHMQGPGLDLVDFSSWHKMLDSGCAADDKFQKVRRALV